MFEMITRIFGGNVPAELKDPREQAAAVLRMSPEALAAFEESYKKNILDAGYDSGEIFDVSAQQAKAGRDGVPNGAASEYFDGLAGRIVRELLEQTPYMDWDGTGLTTGMCLEPERTEETGIAVLSPVTRQEIMAVPEPLRPQLSGSLLCRDIEEPAYLTLMQCYGTWLHARDPKRRQDAYEMFRRGLDTLDLDPVTHAILGTNRNSIGHWLPALAYAVGRQDFFRMPKTRVITVPLTLLQLSRLDYDRLTAGTMKILDRFCMEAFGLDVGKDYFVKTGTFSSKFDFRNAHVHGEKEVRELGQYLLYISHQAVTMAGYLSKPSFYGVSTTNEWVVREYIPDVEENPTIYKGLPLRTEYRLFVDVDRLSVLGINPYWDPKVMKQRFGHEPDANSPHQVHDYVTYRANEDRLMLRYNANKTSVWRHVSEMLYDMREAGLTGQWSLDVMQNGSDFYVIDMALAQNSALSECVPADRLRPEREDWIPRLPGHGA